MNRQEKTIKNPVLGAICGDMIGSPYEFRKNQAEKDFPLWTNYSKFTDDTVMTIAVAEWLLTPPYNTNNLIKIMQKWGKRYPNVGYGGMFRKWLKEENPQPYNSYGNGSAMRVAPVGCVFNTEETTLIMAEQSASVSHNHLEGIKGARMIAYCIWNAFREDDYLERCIKNKAKQFGYNVDRTPGYIKKLGYKFDSTCQGSVPEAICCFLNANSYEETVRNAVYLNGDTDTQAAIAGSIAAARWGVPRDIADEGLERLPDDLYDVLKDFSERYNLDL